MEMMEMMMETEAAANGPSASSYHRDEQLKPRQTHRPCTAALITAEESGTVVEMRKSVKRTFLRR